MPPARWLAQYRADWLPSDIVAGVALAAYAIPVALAYAGLADLPPQVGIYGYLLGGLGYALLGSSRQRAIGTISSSGPSCWADNSAEASYLVLGISGVAIMLLVLGQCLLPGKPVAPLLRWRSSLHPCLDFLPMDWQRRERSRPGCRPA